MITVNVSYQIHTQRIADLMITAFEGGANYWLASAKLLNHEAQLTEKPRYSDPKLYEDNFQIELKTDDGETRYLTPYVVRRGLEKMAAETPDHFNDIIIENEDATTADVFLQMCAFGKLVYG